jgi:hypothetical protein
VQHFSLMKQIFRAWGIAAETDPTEYRNRSGPTKLGKRATEQAFDFNHSWRIVAQSSPDAW